MTDSRDKSIASIVFTKRDLALCKPDLHKKREKDFITFKILELNVRRLLSARIEGLLFLEIGSHYNMFPKIETCLLNEK